MCTDDGAVGVFNSPNFAFYTLIHAPIGYHCEPYLGCTDVCHALYFNSRSADAYLLDKTVI